jgi:hypothetical protein
VLVLIVLLLPLSRMIHGVHYPQDIVAGRLLSGTMLLGWVLLRARIRRFAARSSLPQIITLAAAFCLLSVLISWLTDADGHGLRENKAMTAAVAAGMTGLKIEHAYIRFAAESGGIGRRVLRVLCGLVLMVALYGGLKLLFELRELPLCAVLTLRFVRYAALGLWSTAGAPWLFVKTGLAARA